MLIVVNKRDGIADVLFEANLAVFGLLTESGFVFAVKGCVLVVLAFDVASDQGKLEETGESGGDQ